MNNTDDKISTKLLERKYDAAQHERFARMEGALHAWRAEIVKAMAARIADVGNARDVELTIMSAEMRDFQRLCDLFESIAFGPPPDGVE